MAEVAPDMRTPRWYWTCWDFCAQFVVVLWPLRVNIILAFIAWMAMGAVDQAQDAQRVIVDEFAVGGLRLRFVVTAIACAVVAGNLWFWSRTTLNIVYPGGLSTPLSRGVATWTPRILGIVPPMAMAYACFSIGLQIRQSGAEIKTDGRLLGAAFTWIGVAALLLASYVFRRHVLKNLAKRTGDQPRTLMMRIVSHFTAPATQDSHLVQALSNRLPAPAEKFLLGATGLHALGPAAQITLIGGFVLGVLAVFFAVVAPGYAAGFDVGILIPVGPLATVLLGIAVWVVILHPVLILSIKGRFPLVLFLIATFGISGMLGWNENHAARFLKTAPPAPLPIAQDFERWVAERHTPGSPFPVFVVATEGGGIRAAYFTAMALAALDAQVPGFREHLYAVSGVSGGSVGAAFYAGFLRNQELGSVAVTPASTVASRPSLVPLVQNSLKRDLLSPVLARALTSDLAIEAIPWVPDTGERVALPDRARALERAAEDAFHAALRDLNVQPHVSLDDSFYKLRDTPGSGSRSDVPALILNTTRVETGERIIVSHVKLADSAARPTSDDLADRLPPGPPFAPSDIHALVSRDLPLSTAAFLSARFPIVTPPGTFMAPDMRFKDEAKSATGTFTHKVVKHRLADGGYFENSGTATALNVVYQLANAVESAGTDSPLKDVCIHVIQLRFREVPERDPQSFDELASPLRTLLNTREARGELSRDTLEHALGLIGHADHGVSAADAGAEPMEHSEDIEEALPSHRGLTPHVDAGVIRIEFMTGEVPIPLGWALSTPACRSIELQLGHKDDDARAAEKVQEKLSESPLWTTDLNLRSVADLKGILGPALEHAPPSDPTPPSGDPAPPHADAPRIGP